jgi:hypothetical protein
VTLANTVTYLVTKVVTYLVTKVITATKSFVAQDQVGRLGVHRQSLFLLQSSNNEEIKKTVKTIYLFENEAWNKKIFRKGFFSFLQLKSSAVRASFLIRLFRMTVGSGSRCRMSYCQKFFAAQNLDWKILHFRQRPFR